MDRLREVLPAGLVASTALALGLPRGLDVVRESLLAQAAGAPLSKLVVAKGYLSLALAPVAEVLVMKKVVLAVALVFAGVAGVQLWPMDGLRSEEEALQPRREVASLEAPTVADPAKSHAPTSRVTPPASAPVSSRTPLSASAIEDPQGPLGSLQVRVQDGERRVVAGEICMLQTREEAQNRIEGRLATTNERGVALFEDVPVGRVEVYALRGRSERASVRPQSVTPVVLTLDGAVDVKGQVLDVRGKPVPGAEVWLSAGWHGSEGHALALADGDGRFALQAVGQRNGLFATARGFAVSYSQNPEGLPGETVNLRILLDREGGRVAVQVVDPEGVPLEGALVQIDGENKAPFINTERGWLGIPPSARFGRTDAKGKVLMGSIGVGKSQVVARVPGVGLGRAEVWVLHDSESAVRLTVLPEAVLTGVVRDGTGAPVARANIQSEAANGFAIRHCITDADGRYRLDGLPGGVVQVHVQGAQLGSVERRVVLRPGEELQEDFTIRQEPRIHGVLVDASGAVLAGYLLSAVCDEDPPARKDGRTDDKGGFGMLVRGDLEYRLIVRPGGSYEQFPLLMVEGVRAAADPLLLRLPERSQTTASLRLEVRDESGEAYGDVVLKLWHKESNTLQRRTETGATGVFFLGKLPAGAFDLWLSHPHHAARSIGTYRLQEGEALDLGVQSFQPACRLSGELLGALDEQRLAGIRMAVSLEGGGSGVIDRTGRHFRSRVLAPGKHRLVLRGDFVLSVFQPVELVEGEELRVDLPVVACGMRTIDFAHPMGERAPQWIGAQAFDSSGAVVWSSGARRREDGGFTARVSVLPGHYRLEGIDSEGRKGRAEFDVLDMRGEQAALELELTVQR